jgi:hypothetical protein
MDERSVDEWSVGFMGKRLQKLCYIPNLLKTITNNIYYREKKLKPNTKHRDTKNWRN